MTAWSDTPLGDPLGAPTPVQRWIVGVGLPGVVPAVGISSDDLLAATDWAAEHRLTGLLHRAAAHGGTGVADEIGRAHLDGLRHGLAIDAATCRVVAELRAVGIEPIVFKGVAAAHRDYPDPGDRTFYDVDLLVPREAFAASARQLVAAGSTRTAPELGARWESRYGRAIPFVGPDGAEIDLHATLAAGYFGVRLDHDALRAATETFELGGVQVTCFDTAARLLTSCYALMLSRGGSVRLVRDVAQQVIGSDASWKRAVQLAGEGDVVIGAALELVDRWIELPTEPVAWAHGLTPSRMQRRAMRLAVDARRRGWRSDIAGELLGLGPGDRIRYTGGVVAHRFRSRVRATSRFSGRRGARSDAGGEEPTTRVGSQP